MKSTKTVADQIFEMEGFQVRFVARDGSDVGLCRVDEYDYERAVRHTWTVARWRTTRFAAIYPEFEVEVLDGDGRVVHGKTLVSTVRATYEEVVEELSRVRAALTERLRPEPKTEPKVEPAARPSKAPAAKKSGGSEPLGFEATLWAAADKLHGSMDSSEYKHVVLGLVFLKYMDDAFTERRTQLAAELAADGIEGAEADELLENRDEYTAEGMFWVPPEAPWPTPPGEREAARHRQAGRRRDGPGRDRQPFTTRSAAEDVLAPGA